MPASLLVGRRPAICEAVVHSFVTAEDGQLCAFLRVIPAAYRRTPPVDRRRIIETLLRGILDVEIAGQGGRILLVAEPGLAAMLFFAALRLLPPRIAARYASFSTYETELQTLPAALVATSFADPRRSELRSEARAAAAFFFHIGRNDHTPLSTKSSIYAARMVRLLSEQGWEAVDRWLARLESTSASDLVESTSVEELAEKLAAQDVVSQCTPAVPIAAHEARHRHCLAAALLDHLQQAVPTEKLSDYFIEQKIVSLPVELRRDLLETALDRGEHDPNLGLWAGRLSEVWPPEWVQQALLEGRAGSWGNIAGPRWAERFRGLLPQLADPAQAEKFSGRVRILEILSVWLNAEERARTERWLRLFSLLNALCSRAARPWSSWRSKASWRRPCGDVINSLEAVLPDATLAARKELLWALLDKSCEVSPKLSDRVRVMLEHLLFRSVAVQWLSPIACDLTEEHRDTLPFYADEPPQLLFRFPNGLPKFVNMQVELRMGRLQLRRRICWLRVPSDRGRRLIVDCETSPIHDCDMSDVWLRLTFAVEHWPAAIVSNWMQLVGETLKHNYRYCAVLNSNGITQDDPRFLNYCAEPLYDASTGSPLL